LNSGEWLRQRKGEDTPDAEELEEVAPPHGITSSTR
jgi:hypothetical protein